MYAGRVTVIGETAQQPRLSIVRSFVYILFELLHKLLDDLLRHLPRNSLGLTVEHLGQFAPCDRFLVIDVHTRMRSDEPYPHL